MVASRAAASSEPDQTKVRCAFLHRFMGYSTRDLARLHGVGKSTVHGWLEQVAKDNPPEIEGLRRLLES